MASKLSFDMLFLFRKWKMPWRKSSKKLYRQQIRVVILSFLDAVKAICKHQLSLFINFIECLFKIYEILRLVSFLLIFV